MAVSVTQVGTNFDGLTNLTTFSNSTSINVPTGHTNTALILIVGTSGPASATSMTATWNGVSMTPLTNSTGGGTNGNTFIFGLRNPATGSQALAASWTGACNYSANAIAFDGVNQTSDALAFPHAATNSGTGTSATLNITSAVGNIPVNAITTTGGETANSGTLIFFDSNPTDNSGGQYQTGAATTSFSWTISPSTTWTMSGCDVAAAASDVLMAQIML